MIERWSQRADKRGFRSLPDHLTVTAQRLVHRRASPAVLLSRRQVANPWCRRRRTVADRAQSLASSICSRLTAATTIPTDPRFGSFVTTPRGLHGQARTADHPQTEGAAFTSSQGAEDNLTAKSSGWDESRGSFRATSSMLRSRTGAGCSRTCPRALDRRPNCSDAIFPTTETALQPS